MILGHGANTMTLEEARMKLCAQAKILGHECNPTIMAGSFRHHLVGGGKGGNHEDMVAQQSKDAIVYVTIVVVFYVAIVLLLIGTNLRAGGAGRSARFKKHVVEFTEGSGAENRLVASKGTPGTNSGSSTSQLDIEEDVVDV